MHVDPSASETRAIHDKRRRAASEGAAAVRKGGALRSESNALKAESDGQRSLDRHCGRRDDESAHAPPLELDDLNSS
jgi:hypothetical protein